MDRGEVSRVAVASAFGLGLSPILPGSCAALVGVAFHLAVATWFPGWALAPALGAFLVVLIWANHVLTPWAQQRWADPDPKEFVIDEVAGFITVPLLFIHPIPWQVALWGFVLFRAYDMAKLPGARWIDRNCHGPWGIMLDDLVSGVYAAGTLYLVRAYSAELGLEEWLTPA